MVLEKLLMFSIKTKVSEHHKVHYSNLAHNILYSNGLLIASTLYTCHVYTSHCVGWSKIKSFFFNHQSVFNKHTRLETSPKNNYTTPWKKTGFMTLYKYIHMEYEERVYSLYWIQYWSYQKRGAMVSLWYLYCQHFSIIW